MSSEIDKSFQLLFTNNNLKVRSHALTIIRNNYLKFDKGLINIFD
jgi:hypothetical protein